MDLGGPIPLFYPLVLDGFQLTFELVVLQSFPPIITDFTFQIIQEPFDYSGSLYHEGVLISNLDLLILILIVFTLIILTITLSHRSKFSQGSGSSLTQKSNTP
jgi:hypothetical protein